MLLVTYFLKCLKIHSTCNILVQFWRGHVVETLDKWEKEFEIDIRIMLTGKATQCQNILFCSLGL